MAANPYQKITTIAVNAGTEQLIRDKLAEGYVIQHIVYISGSNNLLVVYATPDSF